IGRSLAAAGPYEDTGIRVSLEAHELAGVGDLGVLPLPAAACRRPFPERRQLVRISRAIQIFDRVTIGSPLRLDRFPFGERQSAVFLAAETDAPQLAAAAVHQCGIP